MKPITATDSAPWSSCSIGELPSWWFDWREHQRRVVRSVDDLSALFPCLRATELETIGKVSKDRKLQLTPYVTRLILSTMESYDALDAHPLWRQMVPLSLGDERHALSYDGESENWESDEEMVTPIAQRKYDNRIIVRVTNSCFSYCQFCYHALRTLDLHSAKSSQKSFSFWQQTLEYLSAHHDIEEVILSGGEPLLLSSEKLGKMLEEIRFARSDIVIRIHSRALTFNPFRVEDELVSLLAKYRVGAVGVHVSSPLEITQEFRRAARMLRSADCVLLANTPLLRGVNDSEETLHSLFMELYRERIIPYYLYHFMPFSPGIEDLAVPIERGIELMRSLDKRFSGASLPSYVLPHHSGKYTVPYQRGISSDFTFNEAGLRVYRFLNWKGESCEYADPAHEELLAPVPSVMLPESAASAAPIESFESVQRRMPHARLINAGNNEAIHPTHPKILSAIYRGLSDIGSYPDSSCHDLVERLSQLHNIDADHLLCGSGIDDLLSLSLRAYVRERSRVLVTEGTYPTVSYFLKGLGADIRFHQYQNYSVDAEGFVADMWKHRPHVAYLANPDNPTGTFLGPDTLSFIIDKAPLQTLLIIDEAYGDFVESEELLPPSVLRPNVIRLRSFSKLYGLASLRVGYALCTPAIRSALQSIRLHFGVNRTALCAALAALNEEAYFAVVRAEVAQYRLQLIQILSRLGLNPIPSRTNFVLVPLKNVGVSLQFQEALLSHGVFSRRPGVGPLEHTVRISLPPLSDWNLFVERLTRACAEACCAPILTGEAA